MKIAGFEDSDQNNIGNFKEWLLHFPLKNYSYFFKSNQDKNLFMVNFSTLRRWKKLNLRYFYFKRILKPLMAIHIIVLYKSCFKNFNFAALTSFLMKTFIIFSCNSNWQLSRLYIEQFILHYTDFKLISTSAASLLNAFKSTLSWGQWVHKVDFWSLGALHPFWRGFGLEIVPLVG